MTRKTSLADGAAAVGGLGAFVRNTRADLTSDTRAP